MLAAVYPYTFLAMTTERTNSPTNTAPASDRCGTALLIVDMLLPWPVDDDAAGVFLQATRTIAQNIVDLKGRCEQAGLPVIYVNDNQGRWRSDLRCVVEAMRSGPVPAQEIATLLEPAPADYVVLKPKHSAFFSTSLELLLHDLGVRRLILTGVSADQCVLATAMDARMRDFEVVVAMDCIAAPTGTRVAAAVRYFQEVMELEVRPGADFDLSAEGHDECAQTSSPRR